MHLKPCPTVCTTYMYMYHVMYVYTSTYVGYTNSTDVEETMSK